MSASPGPGGKNSADAPQDVRIKSGDITLAAYHWPAADRDRPTVLLLHGYPDNASVWTAVSEALSKNFNVLAYDVRGAGRSDCPARTRDYEMDKLAADLEAVIDHFSAGRPVHLVGHDWGSIQSWAAVAQARLSAKIASFTSISGPGIDQAGHWMQQRLRSRSRKEWGLAAGQLARSWYIAAFQVPGLGETLWKTFAGRQWPRLLRSLERLEDDTPLAQRKRDGVNGIHLYRANFFNRLRQPRPSKLKPPVQLIVPSFERFIHPALFDSLAAWTHSCERHEIEGGHWLPLSHPQAVAERVEQFVNKVEGASTLDPETQERAA